MTCEISILNRQCVALAADSATTVTEWSRGKEETRYYKSANKIFQLSNSAAVGVMIYGSASLHEVPWELLIKDFRDNLGTRTFDKLNGYAHELFRFIDRHPLFPPSYQQTICKKEITKVAVIYLFMLSQHPSVIAATTQQAREGAYRTLIDNDFQRLSNAPVLPQLSQVDINHIAASCRKDAKENIEHEIQPLNLEINIDIEKLTELAILILCKEFTRYMSLTGIVVAGFGDKDYFPGYEEYSCYGILMGTFLFTSSASHYISVASASQINGFATTRMVDTFVRGCSIDVYNEVNTQIRASLVELGDAIKKELNLPNIPNLDDHITNVYQKYTRSWYRNTLENHARPLRSVIGSLAIDEMAELAETLVMLESLKEKVTQPTESVGGPIDVAVISKSDGFLWIKRKHYFKPELNPRFFKRMN